jgi:hypothetical protein
MSKLDRSWLEAKHKYDAAVAQYGKGSRVAAERQRDMRAITNRILRRDMRKVA